MPIAFDASSQSSNNNTASLTVAHTVGAGADRALYVFVASDDATDDLAGATVTYGGTSLGAPIATVSAGGSNWLYLWRMLAPPSGAANILISAGTNMYLQCIASSWFGVDQATSNDTITTYNVINGTSPRVLSVTAQAGGVVVDFLHRRQVASPLTPDVTQTRIGTEISAVVGTSGSSYKAASGATTMTWTHTSGSISVTHMAVPLNAAAGADTTAPNLSGASATGGLSSCSGSVSTNEAGGTLYAVATASATAPTAVQVEAGQDHTGTAALRVVSQAVSATGTQTVASGAVTGGAGTRYLHFMHKDAAGNRSTVASSAGVSVTAAATSMTVALKLTDGSTAAASITGIEYLVLNASTLAAATAVLDTGTGESTDASGNLVLDVTGLGLATGDVRYVVAGKSAGTVGADFDGWHGPALAA